MDPGAAHRRRVDIGVPDARFVATQWVRGEVDTAEANYWTSAAFHRLAHKGYDERGVPLWIWNAHHTMFDAESLRAAVAQHLVVDDLITYDIRNLRLYAHKRREDAAEALQAAVRLFTA